MQKKRAMSRYRYTVPDYKTGSETVNLTDFLNELHSIQLDCIDEALEQSDLQEAKQVIQHIKSKL